MVGDLSQNANTKRSRQRKITFLEEEKGVLHMYHTGVEVFVYSLILYPYLILTYLMNNVRAAIRQGSKLLTNVLVTGPTYYN